MDFYVVFFRKNNGFAAFNRDPEIEAKNSSLFYMGWAPYIMDLNSLL